ncbi:peptidase C15, pyroglutamyl peptidase I-like protein [Byssothecium circinans]|uniref:Peptidase C15, pyroglutamyl peptidase I-like protein n=1 Tax=Byssothecium circinans TaxID=147558 RepID=A0A6A5TRF4_9PLEO|nr:peptidase C15, pyroglutamyl peptidase I-like protein [Byssothecium circinans]
MVESVSPSEIKVLVMGFGPFLDIAKNPSWEITRNLPTALTSSNGTPIKLVIPENYIPAAYHKIHAQVTALIEKHSPDLIVHLGLAVDRGYFAVEKSASKEGYHDIPDVDRKVFTRGENKKAFGKAPDTLATSFNLETVVYAWQDACVQVSLPIKAAEASKEKGKAKGKQERRIVDVRLSDDVGTYMCGFMFYVSLLEMGKGRNGRRDVVFLHVPGLQATEEIDTGVNVTTKAIEALVEDWEVRSASRS